MKRVAYLLILFLFICGTCCTFRHVPKPNLTKPEKNLVKLSEPMVKTVWIDATFSEAEKNRIVAAYKTVECSTNYSLIHFEFVFNVGLGDIYLMKGRRSIVVINSVSGDPRIKEMDKEIAEKDKKHYTVGLYLSREEVPTVLLPRDRISTKSFYKIVLHEAVHSSFDIMGHSDSKQAIMFPSSDETIAADLSKDDLEFICKSYQCDASSLKICKGE